MNHQQEFTVGRHKEVKAIMGLLESAEKVLLLFVIDGTRE